MHELRDFSAAHDQYLKQTKYESYPIHNNFATLPDAAATAKIVTPA